MRRARNIFLIFMVLWLAVFQIPPIKSFFYDLMTSVLVSNDVPQIAADALPPKALFLDTRSKTEYAISHLPNAQWIGEGNVDLQSLDLPKDRPVIVYCSIGVRSNQVGKSLMDQGLKNVYNLDGGLFKWFNEGKKVVRATKKTKDVHPFSWFWGLWLEDANRVYDLPPQIKAKKIIR